MLRGDTNRKSAPSQNLRMRNFGIPLHESKQNRSQPCTSARIQWFLLVYKCTYNLIHEIIDLLRKSKESKWCPLKVYWTPLGRTNNFWWLLASHSFPTRVSLLASRRLFACYLSRISVVAKNTIRSACGACIETPSKTQHSSPAMICMCPEIMHVVWCACIIYVSVS